MPIPIGRPTVATRVRGLTLKKTLLVAVAALSLAVGAIPGSAAGDSRARPDALPDKSSSKLASILRPLAGAGFPKGVDDEVALVEIEVRVDGDEESVRSQIEVLGGRVAAAEHGIVWAEVPATSLDPIAGIIGVDHVGPQPRPFPLGDISEGVDTMDVSTWTGDGATGAGQKVAIIDSGFDGYQSAQASGDLPAVTTENFCGGGNFRNTVHGTGVAEIIHDVAPQAALTLICVSSVSDLHQAVDYAINHGIDVVNHSVGWFNSSRGDGSGGPMTPEGIAGRAVDAGIVWVQAAGNHANRHWKGKYNDASGDGFHEFEPGLDETNAFLLGPGQTVVVFLKWDRWPATGLDYDLGLWSHDIGDFVAVSVDIQNGDDPPVEALQYTNPPGASVLTLGVAIDKVAGGNASPRMDVFITVNDLQYREKASSVVEPAGHPDLLTVGATCWSDDDLASYSSRGPNIAGVTKPDVAAPTGVTTSAYGAGNPSCTSGFTGTSSAAPHAAGMAALILDTKGSLQPDRVKELMQAHTIDLGAAGTDNRFGAGRVNAFGLCHGEMPNILGTDGADVLNGTSKDDVINAYGGNDVVNARGGKDLVCGDEGDDALFGGSGSDELRGGPGDDVLEGGTGADLLIGSSGFNTASYEAASNPVIVNLANETAKGGAGKDTVKSISNVIGSDFADILKGDTSDNTLVGGKGSDLIIGRGGGDTALGGKGGDRIEGGAGADNLSGQAGADTILGGPGADDISGGNGNDQIQGGDGGDDLRGGSGQDVLEGGKGNDHLDGGAKSDFVEGKAGHDVVEGGSGADTLLGSNGNDELNGGTGADFIDGGGGIDLVTYTGAGGPVVVSLLDGTASGGNGNDILTLIERILGSLFGDELTGDNGPNRVDGRAGDDLVSGVGGDDHLIGGSGTDTVFGGSGTDTCETFENLNECEM